MGQYKCDACDGTGICTDDVEIGVFDEPCFKCNGTGVLDFNPVIEINKDIYFEVGIYLHEDGSKFYATDVCQVSKNGADIHLYKMDAKGVSLKKVLEESFVKCQKAKLISIDKSVKQFLEEVL